MIGFILSKLNLLILVTAIFAVVAYFSFWLGTSMVKFQADDLIDRYSRNAESVIYAPNQCSVTSISIPGWLDYFGSVDTGNRYFFLLDISKIPGVSSTADEKPVNNLVVSVRDKKTKEVVSARSFGTTADIWLFEWSDEQTLSKLGAEENVILLNPQAKLPIDVVYLAKEIVKGQSYFYVIPCSSKAHTCDAALGQAGNLIATSNGRDNVSACLAIGSTCSVSGSYEGNLDSSTNTCNFYCSNCNTASECKAVWKNKIPGTDFFEGDSGKATKGVGDGC